MGGSVQYKAVPSEWLSISSSGTSAEARDWAFGLQRPRHLSAFSSLSLPSTSGIKHMLLTPASVTSTSSMVPAIRAKPTLMRVNMSGTWIKDKARSTPMDEAIALMGLGGVIRQAIRLVRGVQIKQDDVSYELGVFSVFPWFKVRERYALDGTPSRHRRRDFRRGGHTGWLEPQGERLKLHLSWQEPYGGTGEDVVSLLGPDELQIQSVIYVRGTSAAQTSVYRRKK